MRGILFSFLSLSLIMILTGCERPTGKDGEYAFFFEMDDTIPYDAFDPNPVTKDGRTLRKPVKGTIARGQLTYHYKKNELNKASKVKNPLRKTPKNLAEGKELYNTFCMVCHGKTGMGDGPVIPKFPAPQAFSSDYMKSHSAGRIFHVITHGSFLMGSYASQMSLRERWKLVQYVQKLQRYKGATK